MQSKYNMFSIYLLTNHYPMDSEKEEYSEDKDLKGFYIDAGKLRRLGYKDNIDFNQ